MDQDPQQSNIRSYVDLFIVLFLLVVISVSSTVANQNIRANTYSSYRAAVASNVGPTPTPLGTGYILTFEYDVREQTVVLVNKRMGSVGHPPSSKAINDSEYINLKIKHGHRAGMKMMQDSWVSVRKNNVFKPAINGKLQFEVTVPKDEVGFEIFDDKGAKKAAIESL